MEIGLSGRNTSDAVEGVVSVPTSTNDDSLLDNYDGDQPPMCARSPIRKILRNVWNVTDPREFNIRAIYCVTSYEGPYPPRIGLILITGEVKAIAVTVIAMLRHGITIFTEPLIAISSDQVTSVTEISNTRSRIYVFYLDPLVMEW